MIKPSAATPALMQHTGRAVVFEDSDDFHRRIDDESLDVDETCILVLKNCGPKGYPGMAEVGNMPLPPKVLRKGITDMVRISDARMSGTSFGTVCLHLAPESAVGGPLAIVQTGDEILLDVPARRLELCVPPEEIARRLDRLAETAEEWQTRAQLALEKGREDLARAALVEEGYDVIDVNFGCPVKKVLGRCRGGYLLGVPETALDIVAYAAHIACQLGAHVVKVKPPTAHVEHSEAKKNYEKIEKDLDHLRTVDRHAVADRIRESKQFGELTENAEYEDAKNEQALVEGRIQELRRILFNAQIINEDEIPTDEVGIGSIVTITDLEMDEPWEITIVGFVEWSPPRRAGIPAPGRCVSPRAAPGTDRSAPAHG